MCGQGLATARIHEARHERGLDRGRPIDRHPPATTPVQQSPTPSTADHAPGTHYPATPDPATPDPATPHSDTGRQPGRIGQGENTIPQDVACTESC